MSIYASTEERQWRLNLITNPPKVSQMFSAEEWEHIVMNELIHKMPRSLGYNHSKEECENRSKRMRGSGNHQYGRVYSEDERQAHSDIMIKTCSRGESHCRYGIPWGDDEREKRRKWSKEAYKNRPNVKCIHCGAEMKPNLLARYHNEKCKMKDAII